MAPITWSQARKARKARNQIPKKSYFLDLPAEIRQAIYTYALGDFPPLCMHLLEVRPKKRCSKPPEQVEFSRLPPPSLSIARTCRQVCREACHTYFSQARFILMTGFNLNHFAIDMRPYNLRIIKTVEIQVDTSPKKDQRGHVYPYQRYSESELRTDFDFALAPLEAFCGLEELLLSFAVEPRLLCKEVIQSIVAKTWDAKQLTRIIISSRIACEMRIITPNLRLGHDLVPGWSYSDNARETWWALQQCLEREPRPSIVDEKRPSDHNTRPRDRPKGYVPEDV